MAAVKHQDPLTPPVHTARRVLLTTSLVLFALCVPGVASRAVAQPGGEVADTQKKPDAAVPAASRWVTRHKITVGGAVLAYTATAGTMLITNDKDEPVALFGYTAYTRDGADRASRPLLFAYNGGPGSASAWLHMGILGPKRTRLDDLDANSRGPFRTVENEHTILDRADLVMLDPVGTGFSRVVGKGDGKDFWGVDQDARSVSDFIVRYLNQTKRWSSPKYILGESYGGMRSGAVAHVLLTRHNVALNGVVLVSPYMDFIGGNAGAGLDVGNVNFMTTYAATAWYHQAVPDRPADLRAFLREAEAFARDVYAPVLFKGARATAAERQSAAEGLARFTGVSAAYWERANLRLDEGRFLQELLRSKGLVVGRIDSRYTGGTLNALAEVMKYDPYAARVAPAIVATFNDYYRQELEVDSDREYVLSGGLWGRWDQRHRAPGDEGTSPVANTGVDLAHAMVMNPNMRVLVQQGYFDLACPYGTVEYFVDHMDVPADVRKNVTIAYYEAGHMMYVHPPSMVKFKADLAAFLDATSR
jgi:carboxypeptidase C (cathepsin A)